MRFKKYNFSALYAPSPTSGARKEAVPSSSPSYASPGLPGEVAAQQTEGALSPQLLADLLDPTNTPHQICQLHGLTLAQLAAITDAPDFQSTIAALQTINTNRSRAIAPSAALQTTAVHQQIATAALCAADDINQLAAAKDPKLANAKAKLLDVARKATNAANPTPSRAQTQTQIQPQPQTSPYGKQPTRSTPSKTSPTRCSHRHEPSTNARPRLPISRLWAGMLSWASTADRAPAGSPQSNRATPGKSRRTSNRSSATTQHPPAIACMIRSEYECTNWVGPHASPTRPRANAAAHSEYPTSPA